MRSPGTTAIRIVLPPLVAAATLVMLWSGWSARIDLPVRDLFLELRQARAPIATSVVTIDEASLRRFGSWPWPRDLLARLVEAIQWANPDAIVLDILLTDETKEDPALARALEQSETILAAALSDDRSWLLPAPGLVNDARIGHASLDVDHDGVMRRLTSTRQAGGISVPALSVLAATLRDPMRTVPIGRRLSPDFSTRPEAIPTISAASVLDGSSDLSLLDSRLVFVGITALGLGDRVMTPVSDEIPVPGVHVHASITEALLQNRLLTPLSPWLAALAAALLAIVALQIDRLGGWVRVIVAVAVITVPIVGGFLLLDLAGIEIPVATLTFFPVAAVLGIEIHGAFFTSLRAAQTEAVLGERSTPPAMSPEDRMEHLLELAARIGRERNEESESRRVLAHELKTPLTSVRGLAQLLSGFQLSEDERKRVATMMVRETTRLHALIEQLLDIERIHLARFEQEARPTNLTELVTSRLEILGTARSHPVRASIEPDLEVLGRGDLLTLVLDNVLGNAMKYAPAGTQIQIRLSKEEGNRVVLEVEDAGPGIPEAERQAIFNRFIRGSTATNTTGLGLGLALVREITSWHRGTIEALPARFRGSIFRLELPAMAIARKEVAS